MAATAEQIKDLFDKVINVASLIVKLTPNATDDKFVELAKQADNYPWAFELAAFAFNIFTKFQATGKLDASAFKIS